MRTSLLFLSVALSTASSAQLNGVYTVNPIGGGNYTTIGAAIGALQSQGVSGPVTISITDGVYPELLKINSIPGTSATNTVTFTSASASAAAVTIAPTTSVWPDGDAAVLVNGADHVRFSHLTIDVFQNGIYYGGLVEGLAITDCTVLGNPLTSTVGVGSLHDGVPTDLRIEDCTFNGCIDAMIIRGSTTDHGHGITLRGNTITSIMEHAEGISCLWVDDAVIDRNEFDLQAAIPVILVYTHAIGLSDCNGPLIISNNRIVHGTGGTAVYASSITASASEPVIVENNMVRLTDAHTIVRGIDFADVSHLVCRHNSVQCDVDRPVIGITGTIVEATVTGNILCGTTTTALMLMTAPGTLISEGNLFHGSGDTLVQYYAPGLGMVDHTFSSWQALGYDLASRTGDPQFLSATDLHIATTSPAVGLAPQPASVAADIDGDPRPGPLHDLVEAGADELDVCMTLNGTYVIGNSVAADYATFNEALDALFPCGVGGPVIFEVEPGTYIETLVLDTEIPGATAVNTITFRGQPMDSTQVALSWPSDLSLYLVTLNGVDHIAFERMTFIRGNTSGTGMVHVMNAGAPTAQNCAFRNVRFMGVTIAGNSNVMVRSVNGDALAATHFERCAFIGGYEAIKWGGAANEVLRVIDCTFDGWVLDALQVTGMGTGLEVAGNRFTNQLASPGTALKLFSGNGAFVVERNDFRMSGAGTGAGTLLRMDNCVSPVGARGRVANNMLLAWDRTNVRGIEINGTCTRIDILNNSVSLKNTSSTGAALYIAPGASGMNSEISNNILYSRTSYAVYNMGAAVLGTLRKNLLHTTSASLAYWGGVRADLAALQAASGQFNNSIHAAPQYVSNSSDLHIQSTSPAVAAGHTFNVVINDIDLGSRPLPAATNYDIGADEVDQTAPFAPRAKEAEEIAVVPVFGLYPNPTAALVQWNVMPTGAERIRLFDATGRRLREVDATETHMNVDDLPAGTYHALVIGGGGVLASVRLLVIR